MKAIAMQCCPHRHRQQQRPAPPAGAGTRRGARASARGCRPRCSSVPQRSQRSGAGLTWRRSRGRRRRGALAAAAAPQCPPGHLCWRAAQQAPPVEAAARPPAALLHRVQGPRRRCHYCGRQPACGKPAAGSPAAVRAPARAEEQPPLPQRRRRAPGSRVQRTPAAPPPAPLWPAAAPQLRPQGCPWKPWLPRLWAPAARAARSACPPAAYPGPPPAARGRRCPGVGVGGARAGAALE